VILTKPLLLSLALTALIRAHSQDVELSVQTGHSAPIRTIAFSPGDDIIASAGDDTKIILWDFFTSKQFSVLPGHTGSITAVSFHPAGDILLSASLDSTIRFWDARTGECKTILRLNYPVHTAAFHPGGESFAAGGKELAIISWPGLKRQRLPFDPKNEFTSLCWSANGDLLAFGGVREDLAFLINLRDSALVKKIPGSATDFCFDEKAGTILYATAHGLAAEIGYTEKSRRSTSTDWMLNSFNSVEMNTTSVFLANDNGEIRVYDRKTFFEDKILRTKRSKINSIALSHNGSHLASAGADRRIIVWDVATGQAVKSLKGSVTKINAIRFSEDGNEILIGYENGALRKTNLLSNQSIVNSPQAASEFLSRYSYSVYRIQAFTTDSAVLIMHKRRFSLDEEGMYDKMTEYIVTWHFKDNYLVLDEQEFLSGQALSYMEDRKKGISHTPEFLLDPKASETIDQGKQAYVRGSKIGIFTAGMNAPLELEGGHTDRVTSVAWNSAYNFIATAGWDGIIRFRDSRDGKLLTTFGAFAGGQFIYINPDGYYFSSKKSLDYIGFKLDGRIYSFEQFDLKFNRPDLVAKYLPYYSEMYVEAYHSAYLKRLKKLGLSENNLVAEQHLPQLSYDRDLSQLLLSGKIDLTVNCSDDMHELDKLHLRVNGVPEFGRFGKSLNGHSHSEKITVELNPGTNYFQLYVTNKSGISSYHETFTIESLKKATKPNLYLVSIGVSAYQQSQYNLNFARKDAEDIHRFFSWPGPIFSSIKTKLLVDSSATLSNMYDLDEFLSQAGCNDVVLVFVAGHGVLDNNLDYYLASYDMDFKNPSAKGISYELFDDLLDKTKSRKKVMFLDACHSGEIDKDEVIKSEVIESEQGDIKFRFAGVGITDKGPFNSLDLAKSLFADMRLNNGTTVVSSAGGSEFAIESENWRNGAFTYCLLYGLSSNKADLNKNRVITLSELQEYLLFEVNKLTNGAQTPTSRVENLNNDFILN
jgi:WD40 repeat protein